MSGVEYQHQHQHQDNVHSPSTVAINGSPEPPPSGGSGQTTVSFQTHPDARFRCPSCQNLCKQPQVSSISHTAGFLHQLQCNKCGHWIAQLGESRSPPMMPKTTTLLKGECSHSSEQSADPLPRVCPPSNGSKPVTSSLLATPTHIIRPIVGDTESEMGDTEPSTVHDAQDQAISRQKYSGSKDADDKVLGGPIQPPQDYMVGLSPPTQRDSNPWHQRIKESAKRRLDRVPLLRRFVRRRGRSSGDPDTPVVIGRTPSHKSSDRRLSPPKDDTHRCDCLGYCHCRSPRHYPGSSLDPVTSTHGCRYRHGGISPAQPPFRPTRPVLHDELLPDVPVCSDDDLVRHSPFTVDESTNSRRSSCPEASTPTPPLPHLPHPTAALGHEPQSNVGSVDRDSAIHMVP